MADIVIFDNKTVSDHAKFEQPHQYSTEFRYVVVNGQLVVESGKHVGTRSGAVLYGPAYAP